MSSHDRRVTATKAHEFCFSGYLDISTPRGLDRSSLTIVLDVEFEVTDENLYEKDCGFGVLNLQSSPMGTTRTSRYTEPSIATYGQRGREMRSLKYETTSSS